MLPEAVLRTHSPPFGAPASGPEGKESRPPRVMIFRMRSLALLIAAAVVALALVAVPGASASPRRALVSVDNNFFTPTKVVIRRRGIVTWDCVGGGDFHNVVGPGLRTAVTNDPEYRKSKRFRRRGRFRYVCEIHPDVMRMTVVVRRR